MNILMLLSRCDMTGVTTHTLDLSSALVAMGHQVSLLVGYSPLNAESRSYVAQFREAGVRVFTVRYGCGLFSRLRITSFYLIHMVLRRYDVIHVQSPYYSFMPWLIRKRFVSTLHVNDLVQCFYYKKATHLIAISRETKEYAKHLYGYNDRDITIINHGVSMKFAHQLSSEGKRQAKVERDIPTDKLLIGLVGSIEKRKGHDLLLQAIQVLPQNLRSQVHVIFVGSSKDGKTEPWLHKVIEDCGAASYTSLFPYQDPEIFYKLFDIFVLPSRLEGFPLVIPEAMLSGCCCIRSNTEGASEQIEHGVDGLIFENENIHQLADELQSLIEDEALRHRLAQAGREKALKKFTNMEMAKQTLGVYNKVIHEY